MMMIFIRKYENTVELDCEKWYEHLLESKTEQNII